MEPLWSPLSPARLLGLAAVDLNLRLDYGLEIYRLAPRPAERASVADGRVAKCCWMSFWRQLSATFFGADAGRGHVAARDFQGLFVADIL